MRRCCSPDATAAAGGGTGDATGVWDFYSIQDGVSGEDGPTPVLIVQTGSEIVVDVDGDQGTGTVSGSSVSFSYSNVLGSLDFTGTISGGHMEGTWEGTVLGSPASGTWRAELVTRALVDVSGTWDADWSEDGGLDGTATAVLTMAQDGTITGTYDPDYGGEVAATGRLHGYDLTLIVVETSPFDRTITVAATVDQAGASATGRWSDTDGYVGDWDATKR